MAHKPEKQTLSNAMCASGALRSNVEGNLPNYVAGVLRHEYLGKPLEIIGYFLEVPQKTVMKELKSVEVVKEVTKLGNVEVLQLVGNVEGSNYAVKKRKHYKMTNKRSPHETKFTKVLKVKSGELSRCFYTDAEVEFPQQWWD